MKSKFLILVVGTLLISTNYSRASIDNTCGDNCTWEIVNGTLKIHGTGDIANYGYGGAPWYAQRSSINSITIDEGITRIGELNFYNISASEISLPTTLKSIGYETFRGSGIHSISLPEGLENLNNYALVGITQPVEIPSSVKSLGYGNGAGGTVIINADSNIEFIKNAFTGFNNVPLDSVSIQCKGDINICQNMLKNVKKYMEDNNKEFDLLYYSGLDENGNYIEYNDDGLAVYTDSTKEKLLETYDFNGNQTGVYKYDAGGNLNSIYQNGIAIYRRRIYSPSEAIKAVQKGAKNNFSLIYQ